MGYVGQHAPTIVEHALKATHLIYSEGDMSDVTSDRWLSVDEMAAYLGVKRYTIYKWIERKKMPAHKVGSLWKFKREEVDGWIRTGEAAEPGQSKRQE